MSTRLLRTGRGVRQFYGKARYVKVATAAWRHQACMTMTASKSDARRFESFIDPYEVHVYLSSLQKPGDDTVLYKDAARPIRASPSPPSSCFWGTPVIVPLFLSGHCDMHPLSMPNPSKPTARRPAANIMAKMGMPRVMPASAQLIAVEPCRSPFDLLAPSGE